VTKVPPLGAALVVAALEGSRGAALAAVSPCPIQTMSSIYLATQLILCQESSVTFTSKSQPYHLSYTRYYFVFPWSYIRVGDIELQLNVSVTLT
jgi:hypothetical protein